MHRYPIARSALALAMIGAGSLGAMAAQTPYYNPANAASPTGFTTFHESYRTIGCPGRGLLESPCQEPVDARPAAVPAVTSPRVVAPKDGDSDGVVDALDRCPATPAGRKVNAQGCELDGDNDGVVDALDRCPATPAGRKVDAQGCEPDGDNDGVVDALDRCPATPAGRKVNAQGCELDGDNDGVVDALDRCPTTPTGRKVNAQGCELDGDNDGVVDALDRCPATPAGDKVDATGCTVPASIPLQGVYFDNNSAKLTPAAKAALRHDAEILKRYPEFRVRVAGHADGRMSDTYNLALSRQRAESVCDFLAQLGIAAARLVPKAYGEAKPIAANDSEKGRARNRRVELSMQH